MKTTKTTTTKTNAAQDEVGFIKTLTTKAYIAATTAVADTEVVVEELVAITPKVWDNARTKAKADMARLFADLGI